VLALTAACATGGGERAGTEDAGRGGAGLLATIVVDNAEPSGPTYSIALESGTGDRVMLGSVAPQATETFEVGDLRPATSWRLTAVRVGGGDIRSERFPLEAGARVHWRLPYNTLRTAP
jgi:hypothetical protein